MNVKTVTNDAGETLTRLYWQRFSVPYEYPVAFTRGLFSADNPLFSDVLALREPQKRHKCLVYVDADTGLDTASPKLGQCPALLKRDSFDHNLAC